MESKLSKARQLLRIIYDQKPLTCFTHMPDNSITHEGEPVTHEEMAAIAKKYEKTILIKVKVL